MKCVRPIKALILVKVFLYCRHYILTKFTQWHMQDSTEWIREGIETNRASVASENNC